MRNILRRTLGYALALAVVSAPASARADDSVLFSTTGVAPNVLVLLDNSGSMNEMIYHPAYDSSVLPTCANYTDGATYIFTSNQVNRTRCGITRTIFVDPNGTNGETRYQGRYLNWLFTAAANTAYAEIVLTNNGVPSPCLGGANYPKYQRTKMNVAKQVLKEIVCNTNLIGTVRFGVATFREPSGSEANGGYVIEPMDTLTAAQQGDLVVAINSLAADTWTPLGEALFQVYTSFMSRSTANLPLGKDGVTKFPLYAYTASKLPSPGGPFTALSSSYIPDPMQYRCQKSFVLIVTDGEPTQDNFSATNSPTNTAQGFADFMNLIGDYNADGETESQPNLVCSGCRTAMYLDDIAKYMHEKDFRPDLTGDQVIDVYTIGFSTSATANSLLQRTAAAANGLFNYAYDPATLTGALIGQLGDIVEKSQSFTAATVPASRTAAGEQIYVSLFTPSSTNPYWNGVLRAYRLTGDGKILASNGLCALDDPTTNCDTGNFLPTSTHPPYWDAATAMPSPGTRTLRVSKLVTGVPSMTAFRHTAQGGTLTAADLGVTFPPAPPYTGSIATNAEQLTDEIITNVRGCFFGTGANGVACATRPAVLSDIFHSNPVVVGQPGFSAGEPSFLAFKAAKWDRDRVIYAGSNGGFLHAFDAGTWQPAAVPPSYTAGAGTERFGFMPWPSRQVVRNLPQDTGGRDYYFVDGNPQASDAWIHSTPTQTLKTPAGTEWRTVLTGGLRQGGEAYYALDVTDPDGTVCPAGTIGTGYPCYMWEFPAENAAATIKSTIGQTWGDSIVARIKLDVAGTVVERWVAIVTGGYHASGDPNDPASYLANGTKGRAIWIVDLKTGQPIAKRQFDPAGDCTVALASQALDEKGMCFAISSTPAVYDVDADGFDDLIVVGDLGGNMWKWVIKAPGHDPVNTTDTVASNNSLWPFRNFFRAPAYGTNPYFYKSFYFPPTATKKGNTVWFGFGSGERNNLTYMSNAGTTSDNNRFYAIKDIDPLDLGGTLQPLTVESDLTDLSTSSICADVSGYKGYFIVGNEGEKWVTNVEILSDYLFVGSYIPVTSTDPCLIGGESYLYRFRLTCGEPLNDGTATSAVDPRAISLGGGFPTDPRISVGPSGDADVIVSKQGGSIITSGGGRVGGGTGYWRELNN